MATTSNKQQNSITERQHAVTESEPEQLEEAFKLVKGFLWDVFTLHGYCKETAEQNS